MRSAAVVLGALCAGLVGCGPGDLPGPGGGWTVHPDDDGPACPGTSGDRGLEFIADDETHTPLADGARFVIEQRPQGDVTIFTPLLFEGLPGGTVVDDFAIVFVDGLGAERGARRSTRFQLPCEEDGDVAAHYYEVFFGNPSIPPATYDGLAGRLNAHLTFAGVTYTDTLDAVLEADGPETL